MRSRHCQAGWLCLSKVELCLLELARRLLRPFHSAPLTGANPRGALSRVWLASMEQISCWPETKSSLFLLHFEKHYPESVQRKKINVQNRILKFVKKMRVC